ncbi:hypothetical protein B7486_54275 [cyanobacterium TDX16]|nr:hypothetical protein B7486_54275 [cyanobacterium TDX16]
MMASYDSFIRALVPRLEVVQDLDADAPLDSLSQLELLVAVEQMAESSEDPPPRLRCLADGHRYFLDLVEGRTGTQGP